MKEIKTLGDLREFVASCSLYDDKTPINFKRNCVSDKYLKDMTSNNFGPALAFQNLNGIDFEMQEQ